MPKQSPATRPRRIARVEDRATMQERQVDPPAWTAPRPTMVRSGPTATPTSENRACGHPAWHPTKSPESPAQGPDPRQARECCLPGGAQTPARTLPDMPAHPSTISREGSHRCLALSSERCHSRPGGHWPKGQLLQRPSPTNGQTGPAPVPVPEPANILQRLQPRARQQQSQGRGAFWRGTGR